MSIPIEGWKSVYSCASEPLAQLMLAYLKDYGLAAHLYSKRDQMLHFVLSERFEIMVPESQAFDAATAVMAFERAHSLEDDTEQGEGRE